MSMHELPGYAELSAAFDELRAAGCDPDDSRLRRAAVVYSEKWVSFLYQLRGEPAPGQPELDVLSAAQAYADAPGVLVPGPVVAHDPDATMLRALLEGNLLRAAARLKSGPTFPQTPEGRQSGPETTGSGKEGPTPCPTCGDPRGTCRHTFIPGDTCERCGAGLPHLTRCVAKEAEEAADRIGATYFDDGGG